MSADCLDILTRVLVASPAERMSMEQIKTHHWFLKGLPPGALEMNDFLLQGLANQEEVSVSETQTRCVWNVGLNYANVSVTIPGFVVSTALKSKGNVRFVPLNGEFSCHC